MQVEMWEERLALRHLAVAECRRRRKSSHEYTEGTSVSIIAIPDNGWQFDSWTGDVADPSSATTTLTMNSDHTITANFSQIKTIQLSWPLVGGIIGGLLVVGLTIVGLIVRSRA